MPNIIGSNFYGWISGLGLDISSIPKMGAAIIN